MIKRSGYGHLLSQLEALTPAFADAAQGLYDNWSPKGDGLCNEIMQAFTDIIGDNTGDTVSEQRSLPKIDHTYAVVFSPDEAYIVDLPFSLYEYKQKGVWYKKPGVVFSASDITINPTQNEWEELEGEL